MPSTQNKTKTPRVIRKFAARAARHATRQQIRQASRNIRLQVVF